MLTTALTAMLLTQAKSTETAPVYTGMPRMTADGDVQMDWHTVVMTIDKSNVKIETTSRFKDNTPGDSKTTATIQVPVFKEGGGSWGSSLSATWGGRAINGNVAMTSSTARDDRGRSYQSSTRWSTYKVSFDRWSREQTLTTRVTLPIQMLGPDGAERQVMYSLVSTMLPLSTFSMAIKYTPEHVFSVTETSPASWPWQVGDKGAYIERKNTMLPNGPVKFRWYRGGFAPIGSTGKPRR